MDDMNTVDHLTKTDDGVWLVSDENGNRWIVNMDAHTIRTEGEFGFWGTDYEPMEPDMALPRIGEQFGDGSEVRRIMQLPEMSQVARRFKYRVARVDVDFGWYPIIAEMHAALVETGAPFEYGQIKEKFAELRIYMTKHTDEAKAIIKAAQQNAAVTCERCGDTAKMRTRNHWLRTLCDACSLVERCDEYGVGDTVDALTPDMAGVWKVTTQGSTHLWDMDSHTYTRFPGAESRGGAFAYDREPQRITRVDRYPSVGSYFLVWFDDPADPEHVEQFRRSSGIERIERVR
ncbi:hypothetical protein [Mycolicibacter arupensis]|uniref:Uncharacterized protein n=1 Tax=Mycolicibacter arupensis TaxID=342002 RepID=A0A5C7Y309_9MYCO|nr:hypothetical protein [Mycolicibacter arupensis]TXI55946.1 MAG: hypothetical protein E6Q54_12015 [Mycolicibacter arupensis]